MELKIQEFIPVHPACFSLFVFKSTFVTSNYVGNSKLEKYSPRTWTLFIPSFGNNYEFIMSVFSTWAVHANSSDTWKGVIFI